MYLPFRKFAALCCGAGGQSYRLHRVLPNGSKLMCQQMLLCRGYRTVSVGEITTCFNILKRVVGCKPVTVLPPVRLFSAGVLRCQRAEEEDVTDNTKTNFVNPGTRSTLYYVAAVGVLALGLSYAAVPLYRIFCQAYSYGGTVQEGHNAEKVETMDMVKDRVIRVRFNADTAASMTWNFKPQQREIKVHPGETALAFYTARNPMDRPVIGISTYNVIPFDAGQYFNKIQCFCFEEQQLNPHEEVHMPVFFYIDPEFAEDPKMENVDILTLSYTFFEAREGIQLPVPNFSAS
ncbi:cytochrome c oxidase assembly protein ctaG [Panulirus ornatus]|uniref:cytochrome c oxidase assembly protein ctaG n=1 Tax=Panulirus ornatus TaxID=150431 RepID=UPI003A84C17D